MKKIVAIVIAIVKLFWGKSAPDAPASPTVIEAENHEIQKPQLGQTVLIKIEDAQFKRLKNHWEIDIANDTNLVCHYLPDDQLQRLVKNLTDRIFKYRSRRKILFRKFINTAEFKDWQKQQANR